MSEELSLKPFPVREIAMPESLASQYETGAYENRITGLSRLNVFIGPNNSGKSRLLRTLFSDPELGIVIWRDAVQKLEDWKNEASMRLHELEDSRTRTNGLQALQEIQVPLQRIDGPLLVDRSTSRWWELNVELHSSNSISFMLNSLSSGTRRTPLFDSFQQLQRTFRGYASNDSPDSKRNIRARSTRVYIPTLRGLRAPKSDRYYYADRTKKDYFKDRKLVQGRTEALAASNIDSINLITGLELYEEVRAHLLGKRELRERIAAFQTFMSDSFYDGQEFTLIPIEVDDVLHVKIGAEDERPVYELGDGIQHLIIMMLPLFLHRDKSLMLFIEEPELYLHPGFQRILIDKILDDRDVSRQVFVTTHSHQFLDITIDREMCSIYKLTKSLNGDDRIQTPKFQVKLTSNDDFSLLKELGVRNSSVLLSNCTIWVEGITDRFYFKRFFDVFQKWQHANDESRKIFHEDLHFSFVEYSGANITHWSFLDEERGMDVKRICSKLFLIADKPKIEGDTLRERHTTLQNKLGDNYCRLKCEEVENLLPPKVITAVIHEYEGTEIQLKQFTQDEYANTKLGQFINESVLPDDHQSKRATPKNSEPYCASSGTLKDKNDFCTRALKHIESIEDLSQEAKDICGRLYRFIDEANR